LANKTAVSCKGAYMSNHLHRRRGIPVILILIGILIVPLTTAYGQAKTNKTLPPAKSLPLLIDIGAKQCIPCKMMAPILDELKREYAGVLNVQFIDVWENPNAGEKYHIRAIPTQIFYDASAKDLYRHMGFLSKEQILNTFKKLGIVLKPDTPQKNKG
jgi:thioredoxin 1